MKTYTRKELVEQLRGLEARAEHWHGDGQGLEMETAAFTDIMHQAARMLMAYQRPEIAANRVLTMEELLMVYHADQNHDWPNHTPPYLYREEKTGPGQWMAWSSIRETLEGGCPGAMQPETYCKTWRLWLCRPTEEDEKAPWA